MSSSTRQHATTTQPATSGGSSLAASNITDPAMTVNPAGSSGGGSLVTSSSTSTSQSMVPSSANSREGDLASSSSANDHLVSGTTARSALECVPTGDSRPSTWDQNGEVIDYNDTYHPTLLPFPSHGAWKSSHTAIVDDIRKFCIS